MTFGCPVGFNKARWGGCLKDERQNMKRKAARALFILFTLLFAAVSAAGCTPYRSSYKAIGFVHTNTNSKASMSFFEFEGTMVFKLKVASGQALGYSGRLESGSAKVYYDLSGIKYELFSVESGQEVISLFEPEESVTVYIIVETSEKCVNGEFSFTVHE